MERETEADERSGENAEAADSGTRRACDQCRARKVRCDKESPCSNCRIAQRSCTTGVGQKPRENKQRVLISTQYEKKIDQIDDRLAGIERLLRNLSTTRDSSDGAPSLPSPLAGATGVTPLTPSPSTGVQQTATASFEAISEDIESPTFEGDSSLAAHTAFASEFLENAVQRTSLRDVNPNISSALSSLREIVRMQNLPSTAHEHRFRHRRPLPRGGLKELPMPPVHLVVSMLRDVKDNPPSTFVLSLGFIATQDFTDHCRHVYFATEDFSPATFIIANNGLFWLFHERAAKAGGGVKALENEAYAEMCRDNMETALANLNVVMAANLENIEALLLGASWAVEHAKPSVAWLLTSQASQLCHILGYHRASTFADDEGGGDNETSRPLLFWMVYMLDRGLSLCLGRASTIQDYDITLPREIGQLNAGAEWRQLLNIWIKHAEIQGNIYEKLYSPPALRQPEEQRVRAARALADEMKILAAQLHLVMAYYPAGKKRDAWGVEVFNMVVKSDEISLLASLTLVYRAIPPDPGSGSTFHAECIETARETLRMHQLCIDMLRTKDYLATSYMHWTILFSPFIPFIVLFCHIIETSDRDDLRRLSDFIDSLQVTSKMSEPVGKLERLCQVLYNVALVYVEAKKESGGSEAPPIGNEVDMYLSALGLVQGDTAGAADDMMVSNALPGANFQGHLGDWLSGNRHMIGLLEDDLMNWSNAE